MMILLLSCAVTEPDTASAYPTDPRGGCLAYTATACDCWSHTAPDYWACDAVQVDAFCDAAWEDMAAPVSECVVTLIRDTCDPATTDADAPFVALVGALAACEGIP